MFPVPIGWHALVLALLVRITFFLSKSASLTNRERATERFVSRTVIRWRPAFACGMCCEYRPRCVAALLSYCCLHCTNGRDYFSDNFWWISYKIEDQRGYVHEHFVRTQTASRLRYNENRPRQIGRSWIPYWKNSLMMLYKNSFFPCVIWYYWIWELSWRAIFQ